MIYCKILENLEERNKFLYMEIFSNLIPRIREHKEIHNCQ